MYFKYTEILIIKYHHKNTSIKLFKYFYILFIFVVFFFHQSYKFIVTILRLTTLVYTFVFFLRYHIVQ